MERFIVLKMIFQLRLTDDLINTGKMFLGLPYIWAGTSGFGFDCSGFTHTIYKSHGITIPRDSDRNREMELQWIKNIYKKEI